MAEYFVYEHSIHYMVTKFKRPIFLFVSSNLKGNKSPLQQRRLSLLKVSVTVQQHSQHPKVFPSTIETMITLRTWVFDNGSLVTIMSSTHWITIPNFKNHYPPAHARAACCSKSSPWCSLVTTRPFLNICSWAAPFTWLERSLSFDKSLWVSNTNV